ncbi:MAG TPA: class III extradiol ring-cleavage dioxygenase [Kofleriaceae bacterium]|nr:class III extradiol ring-cleavage dioxygenase [Kofleriaceae bacterium]
MRQPVIFLPHGGGPWPFVELGFDREDVDALAGYLRALPNALPEKPRALLVVSAHWEEAVPTVMTAARPTIFYDYYGFPPESYEITWPAPGEPALAARVRSLLEGAGFATGEDATRGYDHGTFIPLKLSYPGADIPTIQLSLERNLDPARHVAIGRALAPLRDEGVLIVGSGMSFHNLRAFRDPRAPAIAQQFDEWLEGAATAAPAQRDALLEQWADAPAARAAHPREEHLLPLMVVAGAAGSDRGVLGYRGRFMGVAISAYHFGATKQATLAA